MIHEVLLHSHAANLSEIAKDVRPDCTWNYPYEIWLYIKMRVIAYQGVSAVSVTPEAPLPTKINRNLGVYM